MSHSIIRPAIFYWGTPVILVTTVNEDGTCNIAPISSAWWLGDSCVLGFGPESHTATNLLRTGECVLNLPSDDMDASINALARTTGSTPLPQFKMSLGYRHEKDKFKIAGLTTQPSQYIDAPRIQECRVQMEAKLVGKYEMWRTLVPPETPTAIAIEVKILQTYITDDLRLAEYADRIDPDKWKPMIMSFQQLYGLKNGKVAESRLAEIDEDMYRVVDVGTG